MAHAHRGHREEGITKLAIHSEGRTPLLFEFDQKKPLAAIIRDVCERWSVADPDRYAFTHLDSNMYITEKNRNSIKDGHMLKLTTSPELEAQAVSDSLRSSNKENLKKSLEHLSHVSKDSTFASEFIRLAGIEQLIGMGETESVGSGLLGHALTAFQELMEHSIVSWDTLTQPFVHKLLSYINERDVQDQTLIAKSLSVLESVTLNSTNLCKVVADGVRIDNLIQHISSHIHDTQENAIGLINGLLLKAPPAKAKMLASGSTVKSIREALRKSVLSRSTSVHKEMKHELYVFQVLIIGQLHLRAVSKFDTDNKEDMQNLQLLPRTCFPDADSSSSQPVKQSHWKRLGFVNENPWTDFNETPPGVLALDAMVYFAKQQGDLCAKWVSENLSRGEYQCPFARASISLTKMLCEILKVGEPPSETSQDYMPVFYACDNAFMEIFCVCINLMNKTWREMRATVNDLDRVMTIVRRQITGALSDEPLTLEQFRSICYSLTYQKITDIIDSEKKIIEDSTSRAPPVVRLREQIRPEIVSLVQEQRLSYLMEGTHFPLYTTKRHRGMFWYCRLSPNKKLLHHGEADEGSRPSVDSLQSKFPIGEVKQLVFGRECPHMRRTKGIIPGASPPYELAFSLMIDDEKHLDFVAQDERTFSIWTDGLRVLIHHQMQDKLALDEIETLLNMEMKLHLLDVENAPIPDKEPPIPPDPPNFNFAYHYD
ncbi:engulfment and cell motility protein 1-like [Corticium candelabrum]|uniref:engulfment and cell motility protein 1-like n=1 Tax=Corticium candelabrum TaxID=121492 RepID=UPI002E27642A|nr:engulfment and cell motility protein 1-like [Corticium candelabrum]